MSVGHKVKVDVEDSACIGTTSRVLMAVHHVVVLQLWKFFLLIYAKENAITVLRDAKLMSRYERISGLDGEKVMYLAYSLPMWHECDYCSKLSNALILLEY